MEQTFKDKVVLVTGGVGSIGSEIVKQILEYDPKQIRILDNRETEMFHMQHELIDHSNLRFLMGDIRDKERLNFAMKNVDIVFHAAALKHVPLCEYNPFEAIKTNIYGTQNVIEVALDNNVEKVINIGTDKVTNAINTMGSTKLLAERLVSSAQFYRGDKRTVFSSVRFGNVVGSRGSVLDLFKKQIKNGNHITITDPEMTRFIMSIPQAVNLVLETAKHVQGGETFILKMPVFKLGDLSKLIVEEVSPTFGKDPESIELRKIGLRPGEKMYEDLMTEEESYKALETNTSFIVLSDINIPHYTDLERSYLNSKKADLQTYSSRKANPLSKQELKELLKKEGLI
jgi:UDP-N-acetylglucosamine 4,6-dehydratase/5-epimerase